MRSKKSSPETPTETISPSSDQFGDNMTSQETETTIQEATSEDFETMLDESMKTLETKLKKGDVVAGTISAINESHIIITLGVKQDAYAEVGDYLENGKLRYKVGDLIKGFIVEMDDTKIVVSKSLNRSHGNKVLVKEAFQKQIPVKGKVLDTVKGGYNVDVFGVRAFCPISHIDLFITDKPANYIGHTFDFEIIEYSKGSIILSRKNILAKDLAEKKEAFFANVKVGDTIKGTVARITSFGAFVEIGGFEGLLHISEMSWNHILKAEEIVAVGQEIDVKVISMSTEKISLSLKALTDNPMALAMEKYHQGDKVTCKVIRHEKFGSFVEIEPGVEGLIPISLMAPKRISRPSDVLTVGDEVEVTIVKLDAANLKISLSLIDDIPDQWATEAIDLKQGQELTGTIENITEHGAFIKISSQVTGLMPISKIKRAKLNLKQEDIGTQIEVRISNIDHKSQRLSLEPLSLPPFDPRERGSRDDSKPQTPDSRRQRSDDKKRQRGEYKKDGKEHTQDNDWQKYATNYQSVPEDNPFNVL